MVYLKQYLNVNSNSNYTYRPQIAKKLMERGIPAVPKMYFYVGDVRDVAQAHIKATTVPEAAGTLTYLMA